MVVVMRVPGVLLALDRCQYVPKMPVLSPFPFQIRYEACDNGLHNIPPV
jgi:hypothetical protein